MGDARLLDVAAGVRDLFRVDEDGALYLSRVTPDLLAPPVQDAALVRRLLRVAKAVLDVCVLRDNAQGHLLPAAADKDRNLARRGGLSLPSLSSITGIEASRSRRRPGAVPNS